MDNKCILFLLFYLINTSFQKIDEIQYIDNLNSSNYIIPVNYKNYLYIIAGESEKSISSDNIYKRVILKYEVNSGKMIGNFTINSTFPFANPEVVFAGDDIEERLLTITYDSIGLYDFKNNKETIYPAKGNRRFLKKGNELFYYGYIYPENKKEIRIYRIELIKENQSCDVIEKNRKECGYRGIEQHLCESKGCCYIKNSERIDDLSWCFFGKEDNQLNYILSSPFYKLINYFFDESLVTNQTMISCDFTNNNLYLVCVSISEGLFSISTYSDEFKIINSYKKESVEGFQKDDFIKIIYFNDTYDFISFNSLNMNYYTIRLRYFRYDGNYSSKLDSITNNGNQYLDIDKIQMNKYNYANDMIALNNYSIIMVCIEEFFAQITTFEFYENNSILVVKMHGNFINSFGPHYSNPRLSIFKNSILLSVSVLNNDNTKTGFFIFNYPKSIDINLTSHIIKIKELVTMPSKLYTLDLKVRVLKIPKDFILLNKINNIEIEENEDFDLTDELVLRKYRIKEGVFFIKFKGLATGYDESFTNFRIYPETITYENRPKSRLNFFEGEEGNININFQDCLQGYHHLDYDYNLCTNLQPEGYYLDNETNTYRKLFSCHKHCSECYYHPINSTHMNCISCKKGYNLTEDTNSCYDYLPPQYYLDGNIFRRCHIRCYSCFNAPLKNDMNCLNCISSNYYYKKDTHACILPSEFDKREEEDLTIESSWVFIVFIIILFFSFLLAIIISSGFLFKRKDDIKDDENNKYKRVSDNSKKIIGSENELGSINP